MSCRRACRELLWLTRFGEFGPSSAPHLEHLAGCRACRDEVGFDRAMVQQLRLALAVRVTNATPSESTWERILARAQTPEPSQPAGIWRWLASIVARQRMATAMAGTGLALVLALNMEMVPASLPTTPQADAPSEGISLQHVPWVESASSATGFTGISDVSTSIPQLTETSALIIAARPDPPPPVVVAAPVPSEWATILRVVFRSQAPEPDSSDGIAAPPEREIVAPTGGPPGQPS